MQMRRAAVGRRGGRGPELRPRHAPSRPGPAAGSRRPRRGGQAGRRAAARQHRPRPRPRAHAAVQDRLAGPPARRALRRPARPQAGAGQGHRAAGGAVPGGPAAGQRRLRLRVLGRPRRRRPAGGHQARGEGAHLGLGRAARRRPRAHGGAAAAPCGLGLPGRHPPAGLVRAARRLPAGARAAGAGAGPVRLHHGARRAGRAAGAQLLRAGAGGRAALPGLRRAAPRHQGRERAGGPGARPAQAHRLRLGRAAQGRGLHGLRRDPGVQPPGVDPLPPLPRQVGGRVVPGRAALRHGVRRHPLRARRRDCQGPGLLQAGRVCRVPASHPVVPGPETVRPAILRGNPEPSLDAGRPPAPGNRRDPPPQPGAGAQQIAAWGRPPPQRGRLQPPARQAQAQPKRAPWCSSLGTHSRPWREPPAPALPGLSARCPVPAARPPCPSPRGWGGGHLESLPPHSECLLWGLRRAGQILDLASSTRLVLLRPLLRVSGRSGACPLPPVNPRTGLPFGFHLTLSVTSLSAQQCG